jgi:hypothetical protein
MQPETEAILSSQVHPDIFESLRTRNDTMYHSYVDTVKRALSGMDDVPALTVPVGAAGIHALYVAMVLGYKKLLLFGYDFSYRGVEHHAFEQKLNDGEDTVNVVLGSKIYKTSPILAFAVSEFPRIASNLLRNHGAEIEIYSDGLLPAYIQHTNTEGEIPLEVREKQKYEKMWGVEIYSEVSPGMRHVTEAFKALKMKPGATFADFGCGTGQVVKWFAERGYDAIGVDIAENCATDIPFVQATLWNAEKLPKVEYGFSSDVMDHIPPERVMDTLHAIHDACEVAVYLVICTLDDNCGNFIDRHLHMTIMDAKSWEDAAKTVWPHVKAIETEKEVTLICWR